VKLFQKNLLLIFITALVTLTVAASFYKYVIKADFNSLFFLDCNPEQETCFLDDSSCDLNQYKTDCVAYYKVVAVAQGIIDTVCVENDDGTCIETFCSNENACKNIQCGSFLSNRYKLTDQCSNDE